MGHLMWAPKRVASLQAASLLCRCPCSALHFAGGGGGRGGGGGGGAATKEEGAWAQVSCQLAAVPRQAAAGLWQLMIGNGSWCCTALECS